MLPFATQGAETVVTGRTHAARWWGATPLTHGGFPDEESRNRHDEAWPKVLAQLDQRMSLCSAKTGDGLKVHESQCKWRQLLVD